VRITARNISFSPWLESSSLVWATGFALLLVGLQFLPVEWHRKLWYLRDAVSGGEYWRLLSGNLVHLGWRHLALNIGALLLGIWVFYPARSPVGWIVAQLVCSFSSSLGLYLFSPDVPWCVGMSGALHGLLIIGALDWIRQGDRVGWVLLIIWIAKLGWEQFNGAVPLSAETIGAPVITAAHLWGAVGGFMYAGGEAAVRKLRA
jgi:rhomboid family GlyGly-CTERM serine protease